MPHCWKSHVAAQFIVSFLTVVAVKIIVYHMSLRLKLNLEYTKEMTGNYH